MRGIGESDAAGRGVHAVARVLAAAAEPGAGPASVEAALLKEAIDFFGASRAALARIDAGRVVELAAQPSHAPPGPHARGLLTLPLHGSGAPGELLVVAHDGERADGVAELAAAAAFARAAAASLAHLRLAEELAARAAQQAALARAAKSLNESLDLTRVLGSISREAAAILDAELAAVWRGDAERGLTIEAAHGFPPEVIGYRLEPGEGLAGRVVVEGRPLLVNDYAGLVPPDSPFVGVESVLGVPMRWNGELHGVLAVGYRRPHVAGDDQLRLLETFAELAAVACRNATAHAGLVHAARTDGLTGCLNHGALHDALAREIERARRTGQSLALVMIDLDDFKQVNERHGHLVGDEVLRRVGHALRATLRPYDHVGRYGGDEFAIVTVDATEDDAAEIALRAVERLPAALGDFAGDWPVDPDSAATAGVAEWEPSQGPTELLGEADRALLYGKRAEPRERVVCCSALPDYFRRGRFRRREGVAAPARSVPEPAWSPAGRQQLDRLRHRMRRLGLANALGIRLAALTRPEDVLEAAVDELHRIFGYELCAIVRARDDAYVEAVAARGEQAPPGMAYSQPRSAGLIGRCLREREPVVVADVSDDRDYVGTDHTACTRSEACLPICVDDELWGVLNLESAEPGAFAEDDVRVLVTVAEQIGASLASALSHARLEAELRAARGER